MPQLKLGPKTGYWRIDPKTGKTTWIEQPITAQTIGSPDKPVVPAEPIVPPVPVVPAVDTATPPLLPKEYANPQQFDILKSSLSEGTLGQKQLTRDLWLTSQQAKELGYNVPEGQDFKLTPTEKGGVPLPEIKPPEPDLLAGFDTKSQEEITTNAIQTVFPDFKDITSFNTLLQTEPNLVTDTFLTGGRTADKEMLLHIMGYTQSEVDQFFATPLTTPTTTTIMINGKERPLSTDKTYYWVEETKAWEPVQPNKLRPGEVTFLENPVLWYKQQAAKIAQNQPGEQQSQAQLRERYANQPSIIGWANTPTKVFGLTPADIVGVATIVAGGAEIIKSLTEFQRLPQYKVLVDFAKSQNIQKDSPLFQDARDALRTAFNLYKGGATDAANEIMARFNKSYNATTLRGVSPETRLALGTRPIPTGTQTGAMAMGGLSKNVIPYTPQLVIKNIETLAKGTGAKYLIAIKGQGEELVAKRWARVIPEKLGVGEIVVDMTPPVPTATTGAVVKPPVTPEVTHPTYENLTTGQTIVDQAGDRYTITKIEKEGVPAKWAYTVKGITIPDFVQRRPLGDIERYYKIEQPLIPKVGVGMTPSTSVQTGLPGMEKPAQAQMFGEVSGKTSQKVPLTEVPKTTQALEGQTRLVEVQKAVEQVPEDVQAAYEAQAQIEGLKYTHEMDPVAQARFQLGGKNVDLTAFISIREQSFPQYFTVKQAQALMPHADWSQYTQKGLPTYNKVPRDAALDDLTKQTGMTPDQIADRVMAIRAENQQIKQLNLEIKTQMTEKPLKSLTEPTPVEAQSNLEIIGQPKLTLKQIDALVGFFGDYINDPTTVNAWELTRELRRETRSGMAENLKARAQELMASKGVNAEDAMKQAIRETLSGELPVASTEYLNGLTDELRNALFAKVYHVLKDEPYEMASTVTALTNALTGRAIPRELGIKGGSAFTRLQRVFGEQPKVLKAIEKIAEEKKPLDKVVEGIYHETGRDPIPVDQTTADYLRGLKTNILYEPTAFKEPTPPAFDWEAPIKDAIKQVPLWPAPARDAVIRVLKEIGWSPVDIGGFIKAMKSSVDMSYWRQIMPLIAGHPKRFALSNIDAWKALFSQKSAEASWTKILHSPEDSKLYAIYDAVQDKPGHDFLRPLDLPKGTAQWKGVEEFGYLTKDRLIPRLTAKIPTVKWSNRAFSTGANSHLWGCFKDFYNAQLKIAEKYSSGELTLEPGKSFDLIQNMADYAHMLADWSGRAGLKIGSVDFSHIAPVLGNILYAPRFALGRAIGPRHLFSANPYVRKEAWTDAIAFIGVIGGTIMVGRQLGLWDVETNRNSADFGKIRIGDRHIDPWGGAQQFFVFFSRVYDLLSAPITGITAKGKSTTTGAEYPLDFNTVLQNFLKSKEGPLIGLFIEYVTGKTFGGEKINPKDVKQWADRIVPMSIQDIWEAIQDKSITTAGKVANSVLSFTGFGVQAYSGDWNQNISKLGLSKYSDNLYYGQTEPVYDWADFYSDTASQFKGVDPATLTAQKGFDPKVVLVVETARSLEQSSIIPNVKLTSMNADPAKGKTFADFYKIWQDRQKIVASGDEKALKVFDADERNNQAYMGNISQSQFTLLTQYWSITDKKKQADFLTAHPELSQNPREEWLKSHPEDNARQALAGKADVLTQKAYDIAQNLITAHDIPTNAVTQYLPPADVAKSYFERSDIVSKWGTNSWEDKLIRVQNPKLNDYLKLSAVDTPIASLELKVKNRTNFDKLSGFSDVNSPDYIVDDKARAKAISDFKTTNPQFVDDTRRIEAIEALGIQPAWAKEFTPLEWKGEMITTLTRDINLDQTASDQARQANNAGLAGYYQIKVANYKEIVKYLQGQPTTMTAEKALSILAESKQTHTAQLATDNPTEKKWDEEWIKHYDDMIALIKNPMAGIYSQGVIEQHVAYGKIQDKEGVGSSSAEVMLYRVDNPEYDKWRQDKNVWGDSALKPIDQTKIPIWRIDVKYAKDDDNYDALGDKTRPEFYIADDKARAQARADYLATNADYRIARRQRDFYNLDTPEITNLVLRDKYVSYYELPTKGYRQERFLVNNPDLAKVMGKTVPNRVPSEQYDIISEQYSKQDDEYQTILDSFDINQAKEQAQATQAYLKANPDYAKSRIARDAYKLYVPDQQVENYVGYKTLPSGTYQDDWFMMEHPDFYQQVYLGVLGKPRMDFRNTPTREVYTKYQFYQVLPSASKDNYLFSNRDLEDWLLLTGKVKTRVGKVQDLTPTDKFREQWAIRQFNIENQLAALANR